MTELMLIPPVSHLQDFTLTSQHMLLAHLCKHQSYVTFYAEARRRGDFLSLDNSAYEHGFSTASMADLLTLNQRLQCQEVIAPDVIKNSTATYAKALETAAFLDSSTGTRAWRRAGSPRIMIVPQVDPEKETIDDWEEQARLLLDVYFSNVSSIDKWTLGVSKNMNQLTGGWLLLFREAVNSLRYDYSFQVHCLGMPKQLDSVRTVLKENRWIRTIDTALPFTAAVQGVNLSRHKQHVAVNVSREPAYLLVEMKDEALKLAQRNTNWLLDQLIRPSRSVI